jgi:hypothetical protein
MSEQYERDVLGRVDEGMEVVDREGHRVGTVAEVRLGDPGAVTTAGQDRDGGITEAFGSAIFDSGVPEQEQARMTRLGFVRIDAAGLFQGDRYAAADDVARVEGDIVHLSRTADELVG